ncbi:MAG: cyclic nucleotide-binding domain-containing protein [Gammaproteobacteria bacterium]|nr:cyclic nucleotide-binding domain-containing protein [Gammaproteobacteria bacterium]
MTNKRTISIEQLKKLEPITTLSEERLQELMPLSYIEHLGLGGNLFREGDIDNQTVYLLEGDVQLTSSDGKIDKIISHKDQQARFPLDDSQPRQASCSALTRVEVVRIDNSVLDYMMMWDQMAVSETTAVAPRETAVPQQLANSQQQAEPAKPHHSDFTETVIITEPASGDEDRSWIRKMRHIMAFKSMPPANIKQLLGRMESIPVHEGDTIVSQGEAGDYYYVLTEGKAKVTRTVDLATLEPGRSFGEEALLSGSKRNASITMQTDGIVMRLSKNDFNELLKEPLLTRVSPDEARLRVVKGARWVDVRHAKEYHHSHLPDAINIPLHELRLRMDELDKNVPYIVYCGTGRRSSAATFLLVQKGFQASVLNGGVQVMAQDLKRSNNNP